MAVGTGTGFDLSKLESQFTKLDKQLDSFMKKGQTFEKNWNNIFNNMGKEGLANFSKSLKELRNNIVDFGKKKVGVKWDSEGLRSYINNVNRLIYVIKNVQKESKKHDLKGVSTRGLRKEVKEANELLALVKKYERKIATLNGRILLHNRNIAIATKGTHDFRKAQEGVTKSSFPLMNALKMAFSLEAIKGYVDHLVTIRGEFELQQRALQAIIQQTHQANEIWQKTVDLAVRSPFRVKELVTYTKQLAAYRVEADKLYETNKMLADVSAGLGVSMDRLILAYGQVKAANYLRGTELRQFSEAGINMLGELATYYTEIEGATVTVAEVFNRISKRQVLFSDVDEIFKRITGDGGVFYRMQEIQSETLKGKISNLYDAIDLMMNEIGKKNEFVLKGVVDLSKFMVDNWEAFANVVVPILDIMAVRWAVMKFHALGMTKILKMLTFNIGTTVKSMAAFRVGGMRNAIKYLYVLNLKGAETAKRFAQINKMPIFSGWSVIIAAVAAAIGGVIYKTVQYNKELEKMQKQQSEFKKQIAAIENSFANTDNIKEQRSELSKLLKLAEKDYSIKFDINTESLNEEEVIEKFSEIKRKLESASDFSNFFMRSVHSDNEGLGAYWRFGQEANKDISQFMNSSMNLDAVVNDYKNLIIKALRSLGDEASVAQKELLEALNTPKSEEQSTLEYVENIRESVKSFLDDLKKFGEGQGGRFYDELNEILYLPDFSDAFSYHIYDDKRSEAEKEAKEFFRGMKAFVDALPEDEKAISLKAAINEWASKNEWDMFTKQYLAKWAEEELKVKVTFEETRKSKESELEDWQKTYNKRFGDDKNTVAVDESYYGFRRISDNTTTQENLLKELESQYDDLEKEIERIENVGGDATTMGVGAYSNKNLEEMKSDLSDLDKQLVWLRGHKEDEEKNDSRSIKILNKRISLVKELYDTYIGLKRHYNSPESEDKVQTSYKETFAEAFKDTGINLQGLLVDKDKLEELKKAGTESGSVFSEAMLSKMDEVITSGTYIRKATSSFEENLKQREGLRLELYDDSTGQVINSLEEFRRKKGTATIGWGHAVTSEAEAKKYFGKTLSEIDAQQLLDKDIDSAQSFLNILLDSHNELILTQEQYESLLDGVFQGGTGMIKGAIELSTSLEDSLSFIERLDEKMGRVGMSFKEEFGENFEEQLKNAETAMERLALMLRVVGLTTKASGSQIDPELYNGMKGRSAKRAASFSGDIEIAKLLYNASVNVRQIDFTNIEGVIRILERLKPIAQREGKEAEVTLQRAIDAYQAMLGVTDRERLEEETKQNIEGLFGQYEMSVEIGELSLPEKLSEMLVGGDVLSIDGLEEEIRKIFFPDGIERELSENMTKIYNEALEKIEKLKDESFKRDAKSMSEFVTDYTDKIKSVELKGLEDIDFAKSLLDKGGISSDEFGTYVRNIIHNVNEEISKIKVEKFKDSALYIKVMGNVAGYTNEELKEMKGLINDIISDGANTMDPKELKEYEKAIEKINDQLDKNRKNRFFKDSDLSKLREYYKLEKKLTTEKEKQKEIEGKIAHEKLNSDIAKGLLAKEMSKPEGERNVELIDMYTQQITNSETNIASLNRQFGETAAKISDIGGEMQGLSDGAGGALMMVDTIIKGIYKTIKGVIDIFNYTKELMDSYGKDTENGKWSQWSLGMEMAGNVNEEVMAGWESLYKNQDVIGAMAHTYGSVTKLLVGINKLKDNKEELEIKEDVELVEDLEKAYEKLEKQIDEAYDANTMIAANSSAQDNLKEQIEARERMIANEEAKKDTDAERIEEWTEEIEELQEQQKELQRSMVEDLGGDYDYRGLAEEFLNAWLNAYNEVGGGLKALEDEFDEFYKNLVVKQVVNKGASGIMKSLLDEVNTALEDGELSDVDLEDIEDGIKDTTNKLHRFFQTMLEEFPELKEQLNKGSLSGLSEGISGITEDQADILASYWNSVRGYTASIDEKMDRLIELQSNVGSGTGSNPILEELKLHTNLLDSIDTRLASVIKTEGSVGYHVRVRES